MTTHALQDVLDDITSLENLFTMCYELLGGQNGSRELKKELIKTIYARLGGVVEFFLKHVLVEVTWNELVNHILMLPNPIPIPIGNSPPAPAAAPFQYGQINTPPPAAGTPAPLDPVPLSPIPVASVLISVAPAPAPAVVVFGPYAQPLPRDKPKGYTHYPRHAGNVNGVVHVPAGDLGFAADFPWLPASTIADMEAFFDRGDALILRQVSFYQATRLFYYVNNRWSGTTVNPKHVFVDFQRICGIDIFDEVKVPGRSAEKTREMLEKFNNARNEVAHTRADDFEAFKPGLVKSLVFLRVFCQKVDERLRALKPNLHRRLKVPEIYMPGL